MFDSQLIQQMIGTVGDQNHRVNEQYQSSSSTYMANVKPTIDQMYDSGQRGRAFASLAFKLKDTHERMNFRGHQLDRIQLNTMAVNSNDLGDVPRRLGTVYGNLAMDLALQSKRNNSDQFVQVGSEMISEFDCFTRAINLLDSNNDSAHISKLKCELAHELVRATGGSSGKITVEGESKSSAKLFVEAIEINQNAQRAYAQLAMLNVDNAVINGQNYSKLEIFKKACDLNQFAEANPRVLKFAWDALSTALKIERNLGRSDTFTFRGIQCDSARAKLESLKLQGNPATPDAYFHLGEALKDGQSVNYRGNKIDKLGCFKEVANEKSVRSAIGFAKIGVLLSESKQKTMFDGSSRNAEFFFAKAIEIQPNLKDAVEELKAK